MFIGYIVLCVTFLVSKQYVDGRDIAGNLNWAFLGRFCFTPTLSRAQFDFVSNGDPKNNTINLLWYRVRPDQWPRVYTSKRSCKDKQSILPSDKFQAFSEMEQRVINGQHHCLDLITMTSPKPYWLFFVLADCSSQTDFLPELIAVACAYVILLACSIYVSCVSRHKILRNMTFKIFLISEIIQMLGVCCEICSLKEIAIVGKDDPGITFLGSFLQAFAETLYTLVMLLLALGYTVTKSELTEEEHRSLFLFIFASTMYQMMTIVFNPNIFEPAVEYYLYESLTGHCLLMLKIFTWLVFVWCCDNTSKETTTKYHFFIWLMFLGSAWYLVHPITVIFLTPTLETWHRESVSKGCSLLIGLLGHAIFLYAMRPSGTTDTFPTVHIRRIQVMPATRVGVNHDCEPRVPTDSMSIFAVSEFRMPSVTS